MGRLQRMATTCLLGGLAVVALTSSLHAYGWVLEGAPSNGTQAGRHDASVSEW